MNIANLLKTAYAASTPGKWSGDEESGNASESFVIQTPEKVIGWAADTLNDQDQEVISDEDCANVQFIVLAHQAMPALLGAADLVAILAGMTTSEEHDMTCDDAIETLDNLIASARTVRAKLGYK